MSVRIQTVWSEEMLEAIDAHCEETGVTMSDLVRAATMQAIGREDLLATIQLGRPRVENPVRRRERSS